MDHDLKNLGVPEDKLFSFHNHSDLESEKITAPRYSYWQSVFRVFFRNKLNIVILALLVFVVAFAYIYPSVTHYDQFENLMNAQAKHLNPVGALKYFGMELKWILGTGAAGQSTFQAIWNGSRISISLGSMSFIPVTGFFFNAITILLFAQSSHRYDQYTRRSLSRSPHVSDASSFSSYCRAQVSAPSTRSW